MVNFLAATSVIAVVTNRNSVIVFLDFDGVLRRDSSSPSCFQSDCVAHFESAIRPFAEIEIVVSSSWRIAVSLGEIRSFFTPDIAARIIGKTPELETEIRYRRFREIVNYLTAHGLENTKWVAVDDSPDLFPADAPLLLTQSALGFNGECGLKLRQIILAQRKGA